MKDPSRVALVPSRVAFIPSRMAFMPLRVALIPSRMAFTPSRVAFTLPRGAFTPARVASVPSRIEIIRSVRIHATALIRSYQSSHSRLNPQTLLRHMNYRSWQSISRGPILPYLHLITAIGLEDM